MDATSLYFFVNRLETLTSLRDAAVTFECLDRGMVRCRIVLGEEVAERIGDSLYQALALAIHQFRGGQHDRAIA